MRTEPIKLFGHNVMAPTDTALGANVHQEVQCSATGSNLHH